MCQIFMAFSEYMIFTAAYFNVPSGCPFPCARVNLRKSLDFDKVRWASFCSISLANSISSLVATLNNDCRIICFCLPIAKFFVSYC